MKRSPLIDKEKTTYLIYLMVIQNIKRQKYIYTFIVIILIHEVKKKNAF